MPMCAGVSVARQVKLERACVTGTFVKRDGRDALVEESYFTPI